MIINEDFRNNPVKNEAKIYVKDGEFFVEYNETERTMSADTKMEEGKKYKLCEVTYTFYESDEEVK